MAKVKLNWDRKPEQLSNHITVVRELLLTGKLSPKGFTIEF